MALGAGRWQVIRVTTTRAVTITIVGSIVGAALVFAVGKTMQALLPFGLISTNVTQLAVLFAVLGSAALIAAYLQAR